MGKSLRERLKEKSKKLHQEAVASNRYSVGGGSKYFELPEDVSQFIPSPGKDGKGEIHRIDIIPFVVRSVFPDKTFVGNPPDPEQGDSAFRLDLNVHTQVGSENATVVCPKHSFRSGIAKGDKKGCPYCELMAQLQAAETDREKRNKIWNAMKPKRRCMYNVIVRDGGEEEDKGVQILEIAHATFQEKLNKEQDVLRKEGEGEIQYADIDDGKLISFQAYTKSSGDFTFTDIDSVKFKDRIRNKKPYVISDEELEAAHDLGKFIKLLSYDEILALMDETPKVDEEDEDEDEDGIPERDLKLSRRNRNKQEEDEEDEDDSSSDQEEKKNKFIPPDQCPFGYEMGVDYLTQEECEECEGDYFTNCVKKHRMLKKERKLKK
jgi:hypothetical protein